MRSTPLENKLLHLIGPVVEEKGYSLVDVRLLSENGGQILQIMAENRETRQLGVDECAKLSREIAVLLDVEDPIRGAYRLEVSSPGIDRPLTRVKDFEDYAGFEAKVELDAPLNGQKKFRGVLRGLKDRNIELDTEQGAVFLPLSDVHKARLVLTDDLLKATKKKETVG